MSEPTIILRSLELPNPRTGKEILHALGQLVDKSQNVYCSLARDYDGEQRHHLGITGFYTAHEVSLRTAETASEWRLTSSELPGTDEINLSAQYTHIAVVNSIARLEDIFAVRMNLESIQKGLFRKLR